MFVAIQHQVQIVWEEEADEYNRWLNRNLLLHRLYQLHSTNSGGHPGQAAIKEWELSVANLAFELPRPQFDRCFESQ